MSSERPTKSWGTRLLYSGLGILTIAILGTIFVLMFGGVRGTEIDPVSFGSRGFNFYRIPFTKIQISPSWHDSTSNDFEQSILVYLDPKRPRKHQWQVSEVFNGAIYDYGDPKIMDDLFSISSDDVNANFWLKWSKDNCEIAKLFWPIVSEIGMNDAYLVLPEFVRAVRLASNIEDFNQDAVPKLVSLYIELAEDHADAGNPERVVTLSGLAISHDRNNAKAYKLRSAAHRQLGNDPQADQDLAISAEVDSNK